MTVNRADFLAFIRAQGVPATALPDDSPSIDDSFENAIDTVTTALKASFYKRAVLNYGMNDLVYTAPDIINSTFFSSFRAKMGLNNFTAGVTVRAKDEESMSWQMEQGAMQRLNILELMQLKTTWGQVYLSIVSKLGQTWSIQ